MDTKEPNPWEIVVKDACIVSFIGYDDNDAKATLDRLLQHNAAEALDPRISKRARELRDTYLEPYILTLRELNEYKRTYAQLIELLVSRFAAASTPVSVPLADIAPRPDAAPASSVSAPHSIPPAQDSGKSPALS